MATRKTTKPKPRPKLTEEQKAARQAARARAAARRQGKGAFTGKKRANLIGQSKATSKTAASDIEARAIQEMKAEAKGNIITGRNGERIEVKPSQSGAQRFAADRAAARAAVDQRAPIEYQEYIENRKAKRLEREVGKAKAVGNPRAKTPATAGKALKPNTSFTWKGKEYLKKADGSVVEVPERLAAFKESPISKQSALDEIDNKVAESRKSKPAAKKAAASKPAAKKAASSKAPRLTAAQRKQMQDTVNRVAADVQQDMLDKKAPAAKKTASKPPAGETPSNASGNKPASAAQVKAAQAKVNTYTSQIKDVEDAMKNNRAALRSKAITQAEFDAAKSELTNKKNTLMKARTEVAKGAGIDLSKVKTEEGSRPARNPRSTAAKKTATKPAATKPAAEKPATKPKAKANPAPKAEKPKVEKPKVDKPKAGAKGGAKTGAKTAGKTAAKSAAKAAVKEVAAAEGGSANGLMRKVTSKVLGKGGSAFMKRIGWLGVAITAKDIFDAVTEYDRMNPAKFTGTPKKMYQDDPQRRYGGLTSNMGKVKPATGSGTATLRPTTGAPSSKPKTKSENKKTNKLASDRYTAMAAAYGNKPSGNKPSGNKPSGNKPSGNKPIATPASVKGYRVKSGDTLWDIAQKNNTTLTTIYKLNPELKKRRDAGKVDIFANTLVRLPKK